jgi:hypothetical protein
LVLFEKNSELLHYLRGMKILIIEDEKELADNIGDYLSGERYYNSYIKTC